MNITLHAKVQAPDHKHDIRSHACNKHSKEDMVPVVVVVDKEGIVALAISPSGVRERHSLVAVVHRPHPELHCHCCSREVFKVCDQQHL